MLWSIKIEHIFSISCSQFLFIIDLNLYSVGVLAGRWNCDIINKIYLHIKRRAGTSWWPKTISALQQTINHRWQVTATSDSPLKSQSCIRQSEKCALTHWKSLRFFFQNHYCYFSNFGQQLYHEFLQSSDESNKKTLIPRQCCDIVENARLEIRSSSSAPQNFQN